MGLFPLDLAGTRAIVPVQHVKKGYKRVQMGTVKGVQMDTDGTGGTVRRAIKPSFRIFLRSFSRSSASSMDW
jgi:hypothetical protein